MNEIWHWNATQLFKIVSEESNNVGYPFDKSFLKIIDSEIKELGFFEITYKKELIYIGISKGNEDIIDSRIKKQLESITLRSNRVSFSARSMNQFQELQPFKDFNGSMNNIGCETSSKKVLFAHGNWSEFNQFSDVNLSDFDIYWYAMPHASLSEVKMLVNLSKYLLKPKCNG